MCSGNLKFENMVIKGRKTPIFELLGVIYNEVMSYYYFITPLTLKYIVAEMDNKESFDLFEMSNSLINKDRMVHKYAAQYFLVMSYWLCPTDRIRSKCLSDAKLGTLRNIS